MKVIFVCIVSRKWRSIVVLKCRKFKGISGIAGWPLSTVKELNCWIRTPLEFVQRISLWVRMWHNFEQYAATWRSSTLFTLFSIPGEPARYWDTNNPDWRPSLNLGYTKAKSSPSPNTKVRKYDRCRNRGCSRKLQLADTETVQKHTEAVEDTGTIGVVQDTPSEDMDVRYCPTCYIHW